MTIGLILHPYNTPQAAGLTRALFSLTKALIETDTENQYTIFVKGRHDTKPDIAGAQWDYVELPSHAFWLDVGLRHAPPQDVYVFFTPMLPFFWTSRKSVAIVHDLSYRDIKQDSLLGRFKNRVVALVHAWSLKRATQVVAISESTKREVVRYHRFSENKITTIYNGFEPRCTSEARTMSEAPFFLFVGVIKPRKNVLRLVEAYARYYAERSVQGKPVWKLVVVGKGSGPYYDAIVSVIQEHHLESFVELRGYVADVDLGPLFNQASAFVFPTLVEGFGLPVLEAMQCGVPVLTANRGALKEVAGGAALLVDPEDTTSIAQGFYRMTDDEAMRTDLVERGKKRHTMFSWKQAAEEYRKVLAAMMEV